MKICDVTKCLNVTVHEVHLMVRKARQTLSYCDTNWMLRELLFCRCSLTELTLVSVPVVYISIFGYNIEIKYYWKRTKGQKLVRAR